MTYILGAKCKDGVVLIADRKHTFPNRPPEYRDKLFQYYYPIVIGGSGADPIIPTFLNVALHVVQNIYPARNEPKNISGIIYTSAFPATTNDSLDYSLYLRKIEEKVNELNARYKDTLQNTIFDVLVAAQTKDSGAILHYVYAERVAEPILSHRVLGDAEQYGSIFLRDFQPNTMTMTEVAECGYFIIKYIEHFKLSDHGY